MRVLKAYPHIWIMSTHFENAYRDTVMNRSKAYYIYFGLILGALATLLPIADGFKFNEALAAPKSTQQIAEKLGKQEEEINKFPNKWKRWCPKEEKRVITLFGVPLDTQNSLPEPQNPSTNPYPGRGTDLKNMSPSNPSWRGYGRDNQIGAMHYFSW